MKRVKKKRVPFHPPFASCYDVWSEVKVISTINI